MPEKMENNWEVTSTEAKIKSFTKEHENAKMKNEGHFLLHKTIQGVSSK